MFGKVLDKLGIKTRKGKENTYGYIFILPWLIGILCFTLGPMIFSLITSFTNYNMLKMDFTGLANYKKMFFQDQLFWKALKNTLYYALLNIPLITAGGVIVAVILNKSIFGLRTFRTIYYLPSIMVGVGTYFLWMLLLDPANGLVNSALALIGIKGPAWLTDPNWTKPAIILMHLWGLGGQMLLYLARLQSIPQDYYEAASLDGASGFKKFTKITVPLLSPIIFYNLTIGIIGAFQIFQEGYIFSGDGTGKPAGSLLFYNLHLWNQAFKNFKTGYANAMCWFLFAVVMILTVINQKISNKWVYYEEGESND
ncbi:carbohydrate ABC transporter permease [Eisenbergiella tayi]|uniref:Lactose transport system permease protein LacF n=1 Tax=Eisenbergiella tayi TaxID=1432052 RepID=A0A1E3AEN9_9FIRM|nr:sugar ABC transporter permease [Eisenbergiella tayi]ODM07210.1 Lactose transport system permease protein LacF [Eisenbergiella tayi]